MGNSILSQEGSIELSYQNKAKTPVISIKSPLYQTNLLADAKAILSKGVYRTVKLIVKYIQDTNKDFSELLPLTEEEENNETGIQNQKVLRLVIPPQKIKEWYPDEHRHRELKAAAEWLVGAVVNYELPNKGWKKRPLVSGIGYNADEGLTVDIGALMVPLFNVNKEKNFTLLDFSAAMSIQSKAATFFYDKCCKWRSAGIFTCTPEELSEAIGVKCTPGRINARYIIPAEVEIANLFAQCKVDFYFESFVTRSGVGRGGGIDRYVFRIFKCYPDSQKDKAERNSQKKSIEEIIRNIVPSMWHDGIAMQLENLTRYELFDLCRDMMSFHDRVLQKKIQDIRGYLWSLLSEYYSINPTGDVRIRNKKNSKYPKYKKVAPSFFEIIGEEVYKTTEEEFARQKVQSTDWYEYWHDAVNYICDNFSNEDSIISDQDRLIISSLFNTPGNIVPDYDGSVLNIKFKESIYKMYIKEPYAPFLNGLKDLMKKAFFAYFPKIDTLVYTELDKNKEVRKELIFPESAPNK